MSIVRNSVRHFSWTSVFRSRWDHILRSEVGLYHHLEYFVHPLIKVNLNFKDGKWHPCILFWTPKKDRFIYFHKNPCWNSPSQHEGIYDVELNAEVEAICVHASFYPRVRISPLHFLASYTIVSRLDCLFENIFSNVKICKKLQLCT